MYNRNGLLVGKPEEKVQLSITWRRWKDNIKINLEEIGYGLDLLTSE
jgi:hypothetical protein